MLDSKCLTANSLFALPHGIGHGLHYILKQFVCHPWQVLETSTQS